MYLNRFCKVQFISNPSPDHSSFNDYIVTIKFHLFSIFIIQPDVHSRTEFVTVNVSHLEPFEGDPQFGVGYITGHFEYCVGVFRRRFLRVFIFETLFVVGLDLWTETRRY